jgi:hypothetical protein
MAMGFVTYCVGKLPYIEVLFPQNIRQHVNLWFLIYNTWQLYVFWLLIQMKISLFFFRKWPVKMTGKVRICPDNSPFWPDIVRWPAVISRPGIRQPKLWVQQGNFKGMRQAKF